MNELRIVPRIALVVYFGFVGYVSLWFMELPDPTGVQMTFATLIAGLLPAVIGLYQGSIRMGHANDSSNI